MGGGASTAQRHQKLGKSQQAIVELMMPLYFDPVDCTVEEHKLAQASWDLVLKDKTPEFLARKGTPGFPYLSCVTFFFDTFYCRLFDIHPISRELFRHGMKGQGKFLVMMLTVALSEFEKPTQFDKTLIKLAEVHYKRSVKAIEYGVVGDVLLWTLHKVLGDSYYTPDLHRIWIKIYSRMLKTIIPVAVACEIKGKAAAAAASGNGACNEDEMPTTRREGAHTCMFHGQKLDSTADDETAQLKCQAMLDKRSDDTVHVRPASKV